MQVPGKRIAPRISTGQERREIKLKNFFFLTALACWLLAANLLPGITSTVFGQSSPATTNPSLWQRMQRINARTRNVRDLSADFEQEKFTAMLEQPLVSRGTVRLRGSVMLWKTQSPEPTVMRIDPNSIQIYYPNQKTLEVYPTEQKLASLVASPLPRLEVLEKYFTFSELPLKQMGQSDESRFLALQLKPLGELSQHVKSVRVLLETRTGFIIRMEMTDTDQDRTVLTFSHIKTNTGVRAPSVQLDLPKDVKVTHPLAGLEQGAGEK